MSDERASRRATAGTVVVVVACAAATGLLLSGWTPGPSASPSEPVPVATSTRPSSSPPATTRAAPEPVVRGEAAAQVFADQCGVCHVLAAAGTTGRAGPNLDVLHPSRARVLRAIRDGGRGSGLMPPGMLTGRDAVRVAAFVAASTRR